MFYSSLIGAVINVLFPTVIRLNYTLGVISRILLGICHSGTSTAMTEAWSKWAPGQEKSFLLNITYSGMTFGLMLTNLVGGLIVQKFGWSIMFYLSAGVTIVWCIL